MKNNGLILEPRLPGKVIYPNEYQFTKRELNMLDIEAIRQREAVVVVDVSGRMQKIEPQNLKGLAGRFAGLKSHKDINQFASEYGLLGVRGYSRLVNAGSPIYGSKSYEPITLWNRHIQVIQRLLLLYRALDRRRRGFEVEIEEELLVSEEQGDNKLYVAWVDDVNANRPYVPITVLLESEEYSAVTMLTTCIRNGLRGVNLDYSTITPESDSRLGFRITETRSTPYLLAAIYFDLWQLITDNRLVTICDHCGRPMEMSGKKKYCDAACRQAAYRKRKKKEAKN
jgi:hypothetical protein